MTAVAQREIYDQGAYPLPVAAALAHLSTQTVRRWTTGYDYKRNGMLRHSPPVRLLAPTSAYNDGRVSKTEALDFEQLLTLLLVKTFNDKGLSLQTIKRAAARAQEIYEVDNPFTTRRFRSDGSRVFLELQAPGAEKRMVDVLSDQHQFREVVEPSLFRDVVFADDRAREWWPLGQKRHVVIEPTRQFGAPHVAGKGVRTEVVAQAVTAEGGGETAILAVAEWFRLTEDEVRAAVHFEGPWLHSA